MTFLHRSSVVSATSENTAGYTLRIKGYTLLNLNVVVFLSSSSLCDSPCLILIASNSRSVSRCRLTSVLFLLPVSLIFFYCRLSSLSSKLSLLFIVIFVTREKKTKRTNKKKRAIRISIRPRPRPRLIRIRIRRSRDANLRRRPRPRRRRSIPNRTPFRSPFRSSTNVLPNRRRLFRDI